MNDYAALASFYDTLMSEDYEVRADYLLALFSRYREAPASLLDLCCGTGRLTSLLADRGFDMTGVDASADMLMQAHDERVLWLCQDMRRLDLRDTVDAAVCTLDSFNHLLSRSDIEMTLRRLRLFIAPAGLLIFDVNTPHKHRDILGNNDFILEKPGLLCAWSSRYDEKDRTVCSTLDFFSEGADGRYARFSDEVTERAYSLAEWKTMLAHGGFELLDAFSDLSEDPAGRNDERWTLTARNKRPKEEYEAAP